MARSITLHQRPNTLAQTQLSISVFACNSAADHTSDIALCLLSHPLAHLGHMYESDASQKDLTFSSALSLQFFSGSR
jgi:hypothetical protein